MYKHATKKSRNHDYDLSGDLARIKEALNEAALDVKGKAGDVVLQTWENAKERSADFQEAVGDYAKEKPFMTLGLTLLAGTVIGFLVGRK